jgi:signal transduction histidine kinase
MEESVEKKIIENFSLTDLTEECISQFEESILAKEITLYKNIQSNLIMNSDKDKVQRLILVLLDNATKYTPQKGRIEVYLFQENKQINYVVSNTAENLDKLDTEKIFDRFYRADDARNQKSGGYGIGLSVAKAIIQSLKGSITVQKQGENKLIFVVKLPLEII